MSWVGSWQTSHGERRCVFIALRAEKEDWGATGKGAAAVEDHTLTSLASYSKLSKSPLPVYTKMEFGHNFFN